MSSLTDGTASAPLYDFENSRAGGANLTSQNFDSTPSVSIPVEFSGKPSRRSHGAGTETADLHEGSDAPISQRSEWLVGQTDYSVTLEKRSALHGIIVEGELETKLLERESELERAKRQILAKKYKAGSSKKFSMEDRQQLDYVLWQLDRIENTRMASDISDLKQIATLQEQFAKKLQGFVDSLSQTKPSKARRK